MCKWVTGAGAGVPATISEYEVGDDRRRRIAGCASSPCPVGRLHAGFYLCKWVNGVGASALATQGIYEWADSRAMSKRA
jgi:uncharacterized protein YodC (DUF2158 family)